MNYRAVLFDLFDTLVWFDRNRLPEVRVDARDQPGDVFVTSLPGAGPEALAWAGGGGVVRPLP